jgi:hypothetical protein
MGPLEFGRLEEEIGERLCAGCWFESCVLRGLPEQAIEWCRTACEAAGVAWV